MVGTDKFGHAPPILKPIKGILKLNTLQYQALKLPAAATFNRTEEDQAFQLEAELRRNQGRIYANVTPAR